MMNNSPYGCYDTRKFSDIYSELNYFLTDYTFWKQQGLNPGLNESTQNGNIPTINTIYYLLLSKYANSHIAGSSEDQFKLRLFTTIFKYAPTWEKKLDIQKKLRELTESELLEGSKMINNVSLHPSTAPSTNTDEELPTINQQNVNKYKKSKISGYGDLWSLLDNDVTTYFLDKFDSLFIKIVQPQRNLWYVTKMEED